MNILDTITVISLLATIANGIGMTLVYLRYIRVIRGAFAVLKATPGGEVENVDLLKDILRPFLGTYNNISDQGECVYVGLTGEGLSCMGPGHSGPMH